MWIIGLDKLHNMLDAVLIVGHAFDSESFRFFNNGNMRCVWFESSAADIVGTATTANATSVIIIGVVVRVAHVV